MKKRMAMLLMAGMIMLIPLKTVVVEAAAKPNEEQILYIRSVAADYNICPELVEAIIWTESSWREEVVSDGGDVGLMQINPKWHEERMRELGITDLTDWKSNVRIGIDYLAELFQKYEDLYLVLMKYNGTSNAELEWNKGNYSEYAISVSNLSAELEKQNE